MNRMAITGLAACLAMGAGAANAQEQINPAWARPARPELGERLYPGFAQFMGEAGRVTVRCQIEDDGHPYLCEVVDESPRGMGFGTAARVVIASAEVRAARLDGRIVSRSIQTNINFRMPEGDLLFGDWTGPEPTPSRLKLARDMVEEVMAAGQAPPSYRDKMLGGLDYDRQQVVAAWIDELLPLDPGREKEVIALQFARLFDEDELHRIRAGEKVDWPSRDEFYAACPKPSPSEQAALDELRRRYCDRYECGVKPPPTDS